MFKFPANLQDLKWQLMHSEKQISVEFLCNHLIQYHNKVTEELTKRETLCGTSKTALATMWTKTKNHLESQCIKGYHNPKQDKNHSESECFHLHPDKAPEWWRENQSKWKENKKKSQELTHFHAFVTQWIESSTGAERNILVDSRAISHIFNPSQFFTTLKPYSGEYITTGKTDANLPIQGVGTVRLEWKDHTSTLSKCLYVPGIVVNLISPGKLLKQGCKLKAKRGHFKLRKSNDKVCCGSIINNLFVLDMPLRMRGEEGCFWTHSEKPRSLQDLHLTYSHASLGCLSKIKGIQCDNTRMDTFE